MQIKGFTLIELLLVIAIFMTLIAIVVIFGKSAVVKGKNTNIASDVAEIKKIAQRIYLENTNGYTNLCTYEGDSLNSANPDLATLQEDIEDLGGSIRKCLANEESYCVTVNLTGNRGFLCIDDEGKFSALLPSDPEPCTSAEAVCP
ncbi:prepilin-type N-terminal cleavage/methylation domain-containing protein [bacterium]|nr:prepilin-type N-terminal cleavage/methylation domain-containing protein [bacterium]